eukprot:COSAG06_NODE_2448_length_6864_cov_2.750037_4_plen_55_part_00
MLSCSCAVNVSLDEERSCATDGRLAGMLRTGAVYVAGVRRLRLSRQSVSGFRRA